MGSDKILTNVISGFKGAGLIPLNREEVLKRLPRKNEVADQGDKEDDNSMIWVSTFEEYLEESRRKKTEGIRGNRQKKLNVPAGRGISTYQLF